MAAHEKHRLQHKLRMRRSERAHKLECKNAILTLTAKDSTLERLLCNPWNKNGNSRKWVVLENHVSPKISILFL